ncbi:hypothetical protein BCR37DRAFT_386122 [Protomyces lactucae-debilis]|uniref:Uncharacterized protein n=1 Tax=Protomyces lactucae-debilis TaxID=2754530 RepID=A0A1Y2FP87_PROLT|nr:uncharacterized protein BCR37DRAFT_386122 [Protomyces lactucae-debilis]ORY85749.1 hypothetical protein BCR37DRAFT_386122 [Protomyces lactucae-debilis]
MQVDPDMGLIVVRFLSYHKTITLPLHQSECQALVPFQAEAAETARKVARLIDVLQGTLNRAALVDALQACGVTTARTSKKSVRGWQTIIEVLLFDVWARLLSSEGGIQLKRASGRENSYIVQIGGQRAISVQNIEALMVVVGSGVFLGDQVARACLSLRQWPSGVQLQELAVDGTCPLDDAGPPRHWHLYGLGDQVAWHDASPATQSSRLAVLHPDPRCTINPTLSKALRHAVSSLALGMSACAKIRSKRLLICWKALRG